MSGKLLLVLVVSMRLRAATAGGRVVDATGAGIPAFLFAFDNRARVDDSVALAGKTTWADRGGHFVMQLGPGFYDVCALAAGFGAQCQKVLIKTDAEQRELRFKLLADPLTMKERGDSFRR